MSTMKTYILLALFALIAMIFFILGRMSDSHLNSAPVREVANNGVVNNHPDNQGRLPELSSGRVETPNRQIYGRIEDIHPYGNSSTANQTEPPELPLSESDEQSFQAAIDATANQDSLPNGEPSFDLNPAELRLDAVNDDLAPGPKNDAHRKIGDEKPKVIRFPKVKEEKEVDPIVQTPTGANSDQAGGLLIDLAPIKKNSVPTAQPTPSSTPTQSPPALDAPSLGGPSLDVPSQGAPSLGAPSLGGPSLNSPFLEAPAAEVETPITPNSVSPNTSPIPAETPRADEGDPTKPNLNAPVTPQPAPPKSAPADDETLIIHGSGAVEMGIPGDWHVAEVPFGREIRLVLTVTPTLDKKEMPLDGIWVSYHVRTVSPRRTLEELAALVPGRLQLATGKNVQYAPPKPIEIDGNKGLVVDYSLKQFDRRTSGEFTGRHVMVQTDWGVCEIHMKSPTKVFDQRDSQFAEAVFGMKLGEPAKPNEQILPNTVAAKTIIGTWKALRSQMKLHGDGRISIITDKPELLTSNQPSEAPNDKPLKLTGRFEAQNDLLLVRWDDGSKLNFRWRLRNEDLLLTDHEGQISLLRKVLD